MTIISNYKSKPTSYDPQAYQFHRQMGREASLLMPPEFDGSESAALIFAMELWV